MNRIVFFALFFIGLVACSDKDERDNSPGEWYSIDLKQKILFVNEQGVFLMDPSNAIKHFDENYFSLIAADENWNSLISSNGTIIADVENSIEIYKDEKEPFVLDFIFGFGTIENVENYKLPSYFLFQFNSHQFDNIEVQRAVTAGVLHINKLVYNGVTYDVKPFEVVKIVKSN